jgi:hypothetical protein
LGGWLDPTLLIWIDDAEWRAENQTFRSRPAADSRANVPRTNDLMEFGLPHLAAQTLAVSGKTQAMSRIIARARAAAVPAGTRAFTRWARSNAPKAYPAKAPA